MESFTEEQHKAYKAIQEGKNIFLTGPAGTGKSYLLHHLVSQSKRRVVLTAMTGCAALLISTPTHKAKTLHSWAGIGLGKESVAELCKKIRASYPIHKKWLCTDLLVIDEISMMTPDLLEKLNAIGKMLRKSEKPFGGIQVLFVGDFFQLPPVSREGDAKFAFESPQWSEIIQQTIELSVINRQKDPEFQALLQEARKGKLSASSVALLKSRMIGWESEEIKPTMLYSRRTDVDRINSQHLRELTGERHKYDAKFVIASKAPSGTTPPSADNPIVKKMDTDASYVTELEVAIGAQVMLIVNLDTDEGLANGSRGVVAAFSETGLPIVKFKNGMRTIMDYHCWPLGDDEYVFRSQIPLQLAYAITNHKVQGATLDCALIDIGSSVFEYGQAYVALSRVKSLDSLYVKSLDQRVIKAHPKVIKFYQEQMHTSV
jgi:ATP-dependent DNA helicase PIF1